ncbi:MAG: STAS domain-containing protein, partial [Haloechinothrix sp.]
QVRHPADGVVVVQVAGELDLLTTPRLAAVLAPQVASTAEVIVLDLSQVDFLSTAALSHLLWARRHTAYRGQELRLVTGPPCVQRALAIVDLTGQGRFATYPALAAALSAPIAPTLHPGAARVAADPNKAT